MNDVDRWIYFEGPEPESMRSVLDAMREMESPRPEDKARVIAELFATLDARISRVREAGGEDGGAEDGDGGAEDGDGGAEDGEAEEARDAASERVAIMPPEIARSGSSGSSGSSASTADEARAIAWREALLGFEDWAELSIRLIGALPEKTLEALGARMLTREMWEEIDEAYLRMLSDDLRAGRGERPALYAAKFQEEMGRRARAAWAEEGGEEEEEEGEGEGEGLNEGGGDRAVGAMHGVDLAQEEVRATVDAFALPAAVREAMGRLPFKAAPAVAAGPGKGLAKTLQVPVMRSELGGTLPLGSDVIPKVMAAIPFDGSAGVSSVVLVPSLTVKQYVSLRFELQARPDQWGETLKSYRVPNEASRRALDEHWRQQLAGSAELRGELEAAVAEYLSWLRGEGR